MLVQGIGGAGMAAFAVAFLAAGSAVAGVVFLAIATVPLGIAVAALLGLRRLGGDSVSSSPTDS